MAAPAAWERWVEDKFRGLERHENAAASDAFEAEAMPHLNDLFRTAVHILVDRAQAEDAVQEVYLQAWKSFANFEQGTNCRAWLFGILFNCIRHQRRKLFRFPPLKPNEEFLETNLAGTPEIPEKLSDRDMLAALDAIPAEYRTVVLLVDVEEFTYKEAAEIVSIPIGTVMSRVSRGRKMLRDRLAQVARSYGIGNQSGKGGSA